jgi:hypothetical protein
MKTKKVIGCVLLMALVTNLAYWVGYQHGSNSSSATLNVPSKLRQVGLAYREDRNTVSQALPVLRVRELFPPKKGIEDAERLNLYEMQKYQRRVLRDIQSQPSSLPTTITPPVLDCLEDRR